MQILVTERWNEIKAEEWNKTQTVQEKYELGQ
jgi:hypothetical protein